MASSSSRSSSVGVGNFHQQMRPTSRCPVITLTPRPFERKGVWPCNERVHASATLRSLHACHRDTPCAPIDARAHRHRVPDHVKAIPRYQLTQAQVVGEVHMVACMPTDGPTDSTYAPAGHPPVFTRLVLRRVVLPIPLI